jgi:hypothetical protein
MVKCPFCHYDNEEGALFCEQCKSDLAGVEPAMAAQPVAAEVPVATAEIIETVPLVSVPEGVPIIEAAVVESAVAEGVPVVESVPVEAVPIQAVETVPLASQMTAPPAPPATAPAPAPAAAPAPLPPDAQPRLLVLRGLKRNVEYPLYEGHNFIGRADEKPVDIDLDDQEAPDRVWSSRQHALITFEEGKLVIEDLNSANGTFVNRARIYPGQKRDLAVGDVVHIGTVQMKVIV